MSVVSGPGSKPGTHLCGLMDAVVVHNQLNIQIYWNLPVNRIQKSHKLFGPMPPMKASDDLAGKAANKVVVP